MHSLTTTPLVNGFLCWPNIHVTFSEHLFARCWAVNECESILVDRSYWDLSVYFPCPHLWLQWVCLLKILVLGFVVALHIATFYDCHGLWTYEMDWYTRSGKNEDILLCPFILESSIFGVYFSYLWARHAVISPLASSCFRSFLFLSIHLLKSLSSEPFPPFSDLCYRPSHRCCWWDQSP